MGKAKERFKEKTLEFWRRRLGKDAGRFRFETLLAVLQDVIAMENTPKDKISVKSQDLLDAYLHEKNKAEEIRIWQTRDSGSK